MLIKSQHERILALKQGAACNSANQNSCQETTEADSEAAVSAARSTHWLSFPSRLFLHEQHEGKGEDADPAVADAPLAQSGAYR